MKQVRPAFTADDLRALPDDQAAQLLKELGPAKVEELKYLWPFWARQNQLEPEGKWRFWLLNAGRGFGKTRTGAEWVRHRIKCGDGRIACVAPTKGDVRRVMVEGESGLLNICWKNDKTYRGANMGFPVWSPTNNTLTWANGAKAEFFSAEDPERLRGPQFHSSWCFIKGTTVDTDVGKLDVSDVLTGYKVLTRKGYKKVVATSYRVTDVGKVVFSDGRNLTGTFDHPIMTQRGWVPLGELRFGDQVCALNFKDESTNSVQTGTTASVISGSTGKSTSPTTDQTLVTDSMYTTSTITNKTTTYQTSLPCQEKTTCATILESAVSQRKNQKDSEKYLATLAESLSYEKPFQVKVRSALRVSKEKQTKSAKLLEYASTAAQHSSHGLQGSVLSVVSTWQPMGQQCVYNIQVGGQHEYFANGILTHNCDEIAAWNNMQETWDMLQFCLRLGKSPKVCITTTPKPVKLIRWLMAHPETVMTTGSSYDNAGNIDVTALAAYEGTRLGRQELYAEVLDEAAGALWNRELLQKCEIEDQDLPETFSRVVVSVDPAVTANEESDMTGIIVTGMDVNGNCYVLKDATDRFSPEGWATRAVELYYEYEADRIVAERNQGGEMVRHTIHTVDDTVPVKLVHASKGKMARAEPVSALYERGKVFHVKGLNDLEDQMVAWEPLGSIGSPDRLDALVWSVTDLALKGYINPELSIGYKK